MVCFDNTISIGAPNDDSIGTNTGAVYVFENHNTTTLTASWSQRQKLFSFDGNSGDNFGAHIALYNQTIMITAPYNDAMGMNSGSVYSFQKDIGLGKWSQQQQMTVGTKNDRYLNLRYTTLFIF